MPYSMLSPANLCPSVASSGVTVTDITKLLVHRRSMFARWLATSSAVYTTIGLRNFAVTAQGSGVQPTYTGEINLNGVEVYASYFKRV